MKKFRTTLVIFAVMILVAHLYFIDFSDLTWSGNAGGYLGIVAMLFVILSVIFSNRYDKQQQTKQ
ncbi:hypothetical protein [Carboxylicivirga marina]|uniref:Uncharacterized protein n=1 Tax=Carboxylicivirga marina TaxID=2800988 RepID=A0ABS1HQR1_9BACT|nr:hypothetical protein [Carboxylicivirga marina]MBK3519950.1 hypothetical protein [Carboxylicivirga marina]